MNFQDFSRSIVAAAINILGRRHAIPVIVLVCALLTYGGVSLFVVAFAVYPFAAELFRQSNIPKTTYTGNGGPGGILFYYGRSARHATNSEHYSYQFLWHQRLGRAVAGGLIGSLFIIAVGLIYLERQRRKAQAKNEGYGTELLNEPETPDNINLPNPLIAISPLILVGLLNLLFTVDPCLVRCEPPTGVAGTCRPDYTDVAKITAIWAVEAALIAGILLVVIFGYRNIHGRLAEGSRTAVGGAILAAMNTASEYGFGAVIAALPGFLVLSKALAAIPDPLLNEAISITTLAGITGSASGGMSIALAAMSDTFIAAAHAANIPLEVFHRVASMASGGMDTLPHNGAVITLLAITGLSHRQALRRHLRNYDHLKVWPCCLSSACTTPPALSKENHHEFTR